MARFFTHYWQNSACDARAARGEVAVRLEHSAGNLFGRKGVSIGDYLYVVSVRKGFLYLLGRLEVGQMLDRTAARERFGPNIWDANEHVIAAPQSATRLQFDCVVDPMIAASLEFVSGAGAIRPKLSAHGGLDPQTLRGVRELTTAAASMLDKILED